MAFLQKRTDASTIQYYTVGLAQSVLIVGLGNYGSEYDLTRHNAGFYALDAFIQAHDDAFDGWKHKKDHKADFTSGQLGQTRVIAIKPTTFMNLSGEAVAATMAFYRITPEKVLILHDDLDVAFGQIRMRRGGGSAGHNGIKSISQLLGNDTYGRLRIGIGPKNPPQIDSADFVLQRFTGEEQSHLPTMAKEVDSILNEYIYGSDLPHETRSFIV